MRFLDAGNLEVWFSEDSVLEQFENDFNVYNLSSETNFPIKIISSAFFNLKYQLKNMIEICTE